jgi:hypothetical protein
MKNFLIAGAVLALAVGCLSPAEAQDSTTQASPTAPGPVSPPPSPAASTQADLTGQMIFSEQGSMIGTVSSLTTDAQGQQQAVVGIEKFLGIGGKNVLLPVSSLQPRTGGGYTTSLTAADMKKLPEAKADMH